ncbi:MAG: phage tail tube protein [Candidatus Acetothermia bacterium]
MALGEQLARLFDFEIYDSDESDYVEIGGVTSFSPSPEVTRDTHTDFDSEGWIQRFVAERGLTFTLEGNHLEDPDDGSLDPGQEALQDLSKEMGTDSLEDFKIVTPGGNEIEVEVSVDGPMFGESSGGGQAESASWSVNLASNGKPSVT